MTQIDPGLQISCVSRRSYDPCSFSIINDYAIRLSATHTYPTADSSPAGARPYRFVSTKSNLPRGLYMPSQGTTLSGVPNFVIYPRVAAVSVTCWRVQPGCQGHCVRGASVTSALCARNNRCIIRFQSGLGVICIDLLSSHRLFGDCGHVRAFAPGAIREPRAYSLFAYVAHVSKPRPTRPMVGNVKRPRPEQLSRNHLFKSRHGGQHFDFRQAREDPPLAQAA